MLKYPLAFLRSLIFYIGYVSVSLAMSLLFLLLNPFLSYHSRYKFASAWCGFVLAWLQLSCGVRSRVKGLHNLSQKSLLVLANHQSTWETLYLFRLMYPVAPILKKELLDIPFWGSCLSKLQPIAIDRSRPREAGRSLLIQGVSRLESGFSIYIFPEGTRSPAGMVRKFSKGAARLAKAANAEIIPVAIEAGKCWPARRFLKFPGVIDIEIGSAISPQTLDAGTLTIKVEDWIRERIELSGWVQSDK